LPGAAILPFYVALGVDLRTLRIVRLFRLLRVLKLLRYNRAIKHFSDALHEVHDELLLYLTATGFMIYLASAGIYYFEHIVNPHFKSIFHSLWWSIVTLTTVGYGDAVPVTIGGKVFTGCLLVIALAIIAVPSGLIASGMTTVRNRERQQSDEHDGDGTQADDDADNQATSLEDSAA